MTNMKDVTANGYRRIREELENRGQKVNHKKIQRVMKLHMKKYRSYKGTVGKITPNVLDHFKLELAKYIEYYNNKRIKAKLKGISPI
ncbi:transposase InsO family protein [Bacillus chungangensis]|uniref:Transposase InsO family protein n=1 Tax=Bacillus chungangensis TaxID=587633 RepID=A0ABT9WT69_9BACI|nr:transposase InsO family protein [Bacillus chungangensis]